MIVIPRSIEYEYRFTEYRFTEYRFTEYRCAEYEYEVALKATAESTWDDQSCEVGWNGRRRGNGDRDRFFSAHSVASCWLISSLGKRLIRSGRP